ncbi:MAG: SDR family oxidoreductase [Candidatus Saccharibacteria bacterium]
MTGASSGIGRACAIALAATGAEVTLMSRSREKLKLVASDIRQTGGAATVADCDVTDPKAVAEAVQAAPPVDFLVTCAGVNRPGPLVETSVEDYSEMVDLNLGGTFFVTQAVVRGMLAKGSGGSIVHMSSQMGHIGYPGRTVYCMTKHGVEGLTKALAVELAPDNIRVNAVAPTFINTELTAPMFDNPSFKSDVLSRIPLGQIGEVSDVVGAVMFLLSPAASMITGTSIKVDGGWTAQ